MLLVAAAAAVSILRTDVRPEWESASYAALPAIRRHVEESAIVGSKDAGLLGYFLPNPVVNLDGLVNDSRFYEQLKEGTVGSYVRSEGIDYLVNLLEPETQDRFVKMMGSENLKLVFEQDNPVSEAGGRVYKLYEVVGAGFIGVLRPFGDSFVRQFVF